MISSIKFVLSKKKYFLFFVLFSLFFFMLFIFIPVASIPGNDVSFQLSIYTLKDYFIMILLSMLIGLTLTLQTYTFKAKRIKPKLPQSAVSGTVSISGVFAAIVGTAACTSCLAVLFGFLGVSFGSLVFILDHRIYFLIGATVIMIISLYFVAKKVSNVCKKCT